MLIEREIEVNGSLFQAVISDDRQALQAAYAAGRAVVGLWQRKAEKEREEGGAAERSETEEIPDLSPALYLVERLEDADEELLKKAVCRRFSMPWTIAETKRLLIREFKASDVLPDEEEEFRTPELLSSYIACQYRFYESADREGHREDCGKGGNHRRRAGISYLQRIQKKRAGRGGVPGHYPAGEGRGQNLCETAGQSGQYGFQKTGRKAGIRTD